MIIKTTPTVDAIEKIAFVGNIIPHAWYQTIRYQSENGKNNRPYLEAIMILSDLIYWYKPRVERDEHTGELIGKFKRFSADKLQRNYNQLSEMFGLSYKVVREAVKFLEDLGAVSLETRNVVIQGKGTLQNVMFIDLNVNKIFELTYPTKIEKSHLPNKEATDYPIGQSAYDELGGTYTRHIPTGDHDSFINKSEISKKQNSEKESVVSLTASNHKPQIAAGGENFVGENAEPKPSYIQANRNELTALPKPKYDFDGIRNLPKDRGYIQRYKNAFETKLKKAGMLTNTLTAEIINPKLSDFWNTYITGLEKDVNEGKDIGLADTLHVINNFPKWFEAKTQGKVETKTYSKNGFTEPTSPTAKTINVAKTLESQKTEQLNENRVGIYAIQDAYNKIIVAYNKQKQVPFENFDITFKQELGGWVSVTDHNPNEHSYVAIGILKKHFANIK